MTVDRVIHQTDAATPAGQPYCFVYFISIHNDSSLSVTIKGRKWVVENEKGGVVAVEGEGVVGQTPLIQPGQKFTYNSFHLLDTPTGTAAGSYIGLDGKGRRVLVRIPKFRLAAGPAAE